MDSRDLILAVLMFTVGLFVVVWINTSNPVQKTFDGKYYISTHGKNYQLVSDRPVRIGEIIESSIEEEEE